jgi:manganese/zinc/iron transport system permease protein
VTAFLQLDLPALLGASLAALSCALVGNFLVLTRRAMVSDALSHVMLPGVLAAFIITGTTAVFAMLAGGVGAALVAVGLVSFLTRTAKVEPSAALGVVFTTLFAAGVLVMEQSGVARTAFESTTSSPATSRRWSGRPPPASAACSASPSSPRCRAHWAAWQ